MKCAFILFATFITLLPLHQALAQRINFGLRFIEEAGIEVRTVGDDELNFNNVGPLPFILAGSPARTIAPGLWGGEGVVALEIRARADLDITVTVTAPNVLLLEDFMGESPIPELSFSLGWSYWNLAQGSGNSFVPPNPASVLNAAIELKSPLVGGINFSSATFPMRRRQGNQLSGPPPPPPDPLHGVVPDQPFTTVYVFLYGTLGAIPAGTPSGQYSGLITVEVGYARYE